MALDPFSTDASPFYERYLNAYGLDNSVAPAIPMRGMLGWTGVAWEKISSDGAGNLSFTLDPPNTVVNGQRAVTTAGTRVALAGASTPVVSVTIKALSTNTGLIYVGDSTVDSTNGFVLASGDSASSDIDNLTDIYLDSSVDGEGVSYLGAVS